MLTRLARRFLACSAIILCLPALADAVIVSVSVPRGAEVPKKLKILGAEPQEVTVQPGPGQTGTFEADLRPGRYRVQNYLGSFTVAPGATTVAVPLQPIEAWMVQNPGVFGAFGIGLGFDAAWFGNMEKTKDQVTIIDRSPAGTVVSQVTSQNDLNQVNQTFDKPFDLYGGFLDVPISLGGWNVGSATLYPAIVGTVGWYDFKFAPRNMATGTTTTFSGNGAMVGGGLDVLAARGPWFAAVSLLYRTNLDTSVDRSPQVPPPQGGRVDQAGDLDYEQWIIAFRMGHTVRTGWRYVTSVGPFVGAEWNRTDVTVNTNVVGTFPNGSSRTFQFNEELESESWRALVGVDVHVTSGLFARILGSFNGDDQAVLVKFVYRFDSWARY